MTPEALDDLVALLNGEWPGVTLSRPDSRGILVASLTRHPLTDSIDIVDFPAPRQPVQVDDSGATLGAMGRGALAVTITIESGVPVRLFIPRT